MHCKVYRLYDHGIRLEKHAAQQNSPKIGRLDYEVRTRADKIERTVFMAQLFATGSDQLILPVLDGAWLVRANADGLLLYGTEVVPGRGRKSVGESYTQAWLCKLG